MMNKNKHNTNSPTILSPPLSLSLVPDKALDERHQSHISDYCQTSSSDASTGLNGRPNLQHQVGTLSRLGTDDALA